MCPNMNHFDEVDFSECHSEEVISFFWRSVYTLNQKSKYSIFFIYLKTYFTDFDHSNVNGWGIFLRKI